jgi:hypothetical protein
MGNKLLWLGLVVLIALPVSGETWYVRKDGGTRYSAGMKKGQCDGKADAPYNGKGTGQHCAFKEVAYLAYDGNYSSGGTWIIAGGDTVHIAAGQYRVGYRGPNAQDHNGLAVAGNPYAPGLPPVPSGTAANPTQIIGAGAKSTQIFGGYGAWAVFDLSGSGFVSITGIELTRHSQCTIFGVPAVPGNCSKNYPIDDYAMNGIITNNKTHDILFEDLWIHGFTSRGIIGPIGGTVTAQKVDIAYNGAAGWDFDDGSATPNVNGVLNLSNVTIEWSGCNQAYPGTGAISCYGQSDGGYGDGIGTPAGTCLTAHVDHSTFRYNVQDGYDMLHNDKGNCSMSITSSTSYGNNGAQFKWGPNDNPMVFTNNTVIANCTRLSAPFPGQPSTYNAHLRDFCRASDAIAFGFRDGGTLLMANNTFITYAPTTFDSSCSGTYPQAQGEGTCANSTFIFKNNIVYGIDNPGTYTSGGRSGGPGGFYSDKPIGHILRSNNLYYGMRNVRCPTGFPNEKCADPKFVSEPRFSKEQDLDNFNFHLADGSPALGTGANLPEVKVDFDGKPRPSTGSDMGAYQH